MRIIFLYQLLMAFTLMAQDKETASVCNMDADYEGNINDILKDAIESDSEDIYEKVFGKGKQKNIMMDFPVFLDGEKLGEVMVIIQKKTKKIHAKQLKDALSGFLLDGEIQKINTLIDKDGFIPFDKLSFLRLQTKMDMSKLHINITVPWQMKKNREIGRRFSRDSLKPNVDLAAFSGFMNTRFSTTRYSGGRDNAQCVLLTPTLNLYGIVLESEISGTKTYTKGRNPDEGNANASEKKADSRYKFYREYISLVYDLPDRELRFNLGDVYSSTIDYQSVPKLWGFGFSKICNSYSNTSEHRQVAITLTRKSTIEIYVNGNKVREEKDIPSGKYTLNDIPFDYGSNDVKIKVIDDTGRIRDLDQSYFYDNSVLNFGEIRYGASCGYPENSVISSGRYDKSNPLFSGYFRIGVADATELSLGLSKNKNSRLLCYGIKDASFLGVIDLSAASSIHDEKNADAIKTAKASKSGKATRVYYTFPSFDIGKVGVSAGLSAEQSDNLFRPYLAISEDSTKDLIIQKIEEQKNMDFLSVDENIKGKTNRMGYHLSFSNVFKSTLSFNYNTSGKTGESKRKSWMINCVRNMNFGEDSFMKNGYITLGAGVTRGNGYTSKFLSLTFSTTFSNNHNASIGYYHHGSNVGSFSASNYSNDDDLEYNASFDGNGTMHNTRLMSRYNNEFFAAEANYDVSKMDKTSNSSTQFNAESTVFFADGIFAVARNKNYDGGFIIAHPEKALKGKGVKFISSSSAKVGSAVATTSTSGTSYSRIDLRTIPDGMNIEKDIIVAKGSYKRGAVVNLSCEGNYSIKGALVDHCGESISLISGYIVNLQDKNMITEKFFTNSDGVFYIGNLKPGKYKAVLNIECCDDFYFEVKESDKQLLDVGIIRCGNCEKDEDKENV